MTHDHLEDAEVHAFVDGHLSPDQRRRIMAALAGSPDDAARASDYRSINEALHLTYDEVLHEPVPARLRVERYGGSAAAYHSIFRRGPAQSAFALRAAALVALALTSGFAGWSLNDRLATAGGDSAASSFTQMAAFAHQLYAPEVGPSVEFSGEQQDTFLLWLSERLGTAISAPSLQAIGFTLVGGRLLPTLAGGSAGQLTYKDEQDQRITLYLRRRADVPDGIANGLQSTTVRYVSEEEAVGIVYWATPELAYALIAQMDREELLATAGLIQQQLLVPPLPPVAPGELAPPSKGAT